MSKFTNPLIVEYIDGTNWKLHEEFSYYLSADESASIHVPKGFMTDFASVPKILKVFAKDSEIFCKASILHDYLYSGSGNENGYKYTREESDKIYRDAMQVFGMTASRSYIFYKGVRFFGKSHWWENK